MTRGKGGCCYTEKVDKEEVVVLKISPLLQKNIVYKYINMFMHNVESVSSLQFKHSFFQEKGNAFP